MQVGPVDPGHSYLPTESELRVFYEGGDRIPRWIVCRCHATCRWDTRYPPRCWSTSRVRTSTVIGINVTHLRNYVYAPQVLALAEGVSPVYLGSPVGATDGLILGASGIVSSFDINVAPQLYQDFATAWAKQDLGAVTAAVSTITSLFLTILGAGGLIVAKAILDRLGIEAGPPRPPRRQPDTAVFNKADEIIEQFSLQL